MNKSILSTKKSKKGVKSKSRVVVQESSKYLKEDTFQDLCKKRYQLSREKYDKFFLKCIEEIEALQPSGFACVQATRFFTLGVLPKYCVIPDPLTKKQRERVEKILAE